MGNLLKGRFLGNTDVRGVRAFYVFLGAAVTAGEELGTRHGPWAEGQGGFDPQTLYAHPCGGSAQVLFQIRQKYSQDHGLGNGLA